MKTKSIKNQFAKALSGVALISCASMMPTLVNAAILNASLGGTFTLNLDRDALAVSYGGTSSNPGHFLVDYFDTAQSDYTTRTESSFYLGNSNRVEMPSVNLVHDITPISASNPVAQAPGRYVKSTTPDFAIDSQTLGGTGSLGMTGVELYKGSYNGALIYGDYSLHYDQAGQQEVWDFLGLSGTPSGWYLRNNISFAAVVYDFTNLNIVSTDATNWQLTGDLLLSSANASLIKIPVLSNMGSFCLGVGSYAGCGQVSNVPVPAALWLFISGLATLAISGVRRRSWL